MEFNPLTPTGHRRGNDMNYTRQAIEMAVENGWNAPSHREVIEYNPNNRTGVHQSLRASFTSLEIFSDPLFWQCLGKAEGWDNTSGTEGGCWECGASLEGWKSSWHDFTQHLIAGKDAESFFREILSAKE